MHPNQSSLRKSPQTNAIANSQLEHLLAMREAQKGLRHRLKLMDDAIEKAESEIMEQLDCGVDLSACGYELSIQETVRRYPAWKEHFISRMGKEVADSVMENTAPVLHRKLVVK